MRKDSKIDDVLQTLARPDQYIRQIITNFLTYEFDEDRADVRIGISGTGKYPNYYIKQGFRYDYIYPKISKIGSFDLRYAFHGRSHNKILEESFMGTNWSTVGMSFDYLKKLSRSV
ncbi:hypothetical protein V5G24_00325 [Xanthobacter sp. VTT E-85241]|jgi:hypothetical protein|uniref:hypothetical protein n=1 Tax=Roseixanthobacter finlandensis TaxID=3119922 RepID=UPI002BABCA41|nr:hypothetical protein [Xanthobacteraceae bacterium]